VNAASRPPALAHRAYSGVWSFLVAWFRVPEQPPTLPVSPGERAISFRPSEAYLRYLKFLFWIALLLIDIVLTVLWIVATVALIAADLWWVAVMLAPVAIAVIVLPDVIAYVGIHLRYDTTWYVLSDRSLRVRHGIWIIRELTLTFENVQNVRLSQGPLQRYFGIASVFVETAGGGSSTGKGEQQAIGHHASIDGITNAEEIRDLVLSRVRSSRSAGLGDEHTHPTADASPGHAVESAGQRGTAALTPRELELLQAIRDQLRGAAIAASH